MLIHSKSIVDKIYIVNNLLYIAILAASSGLSLLSFYFISCDYLKQFIDNIACGGLASGLVAWIIEYCSVLEKKKIYCKNYQAIYSRLWAEVNFYIILWNRYHLQYVEKTSESELSWNDYFEGVKSVLADNENSDRSDFIEIFEHVNLGRSCECINNEVVNLLQHQYYLKANEYLDDTLYYRLVELKQAYETLSFFLDKKYCYDNKGLFEHITIYNKILHSFISSWEDISYMNEPGNGEWEKTFCCKKKHD